MKRKLSWFSLAGLLALLFWSYWFLIIHRSADSTNSALRKLRVLSYSSFTSPWAVGPELAKRFEKKLGIAVEYFDADESRLIVNRLSQGDGGSTQFDVVLGVDQYDLPRARKSTTWRSINHLAKNLETNLQLDTKVLEGATGDRQNADFVPIDWSPLTFIFRRGEIDPPKSIEDLLDARFRERLILLDPRSSGPGYLFLMWLKHNLSDQLPGYLQKLKPNIQLVSPSWSTGYGLFQKGQAASIFSYLTSAPYHWSEEKNENYEVAVLKEALPIQIEYVGIPQACISCEAAEEFVRYLISEEAQLLLMRKNYMLPVFAQHRRDIYFGRLPQVGALQVQDQPAAIEDFVAVFK